MLTRNNSRRDNRRLVRSQILQYEPDDDSDDEDMPPLIARYDSEDDEPPVAPPPPAPEMPPSRVTRDWQDQYVNRLLISSYYTSVLRSPPRNEWKGRDGTAGVIKAAFPHMSLNNIKKILRDTSRCEAAGITYDGGRQGRRFQGTHLIEHGTLHERLVCDLIERGLGLQHTTVLVNRQLVSENKSEVGVSCVRDTYNRLLPEVIPIRKVAMGTNDAHSAWAKASFNIFKQLAIAFGKLNPRVTPDPPMPDPPPPREGAETVEIPEPREAEPELTTTGLHTRPLPLEPFFDDTKLRRFEKDQVGWWDESHRKACLKTIQGANGQDHITRVERDDQNNPCKKRRRKKR